jgi:hypothetical protein
MGLPGFEHYSIGRLKKERTCSPWWIEDLDVVNLQLPMAGDHFKIFILMPYWDIIFYGVPSNQAVVTFANSDSLLPQGRTELGSS